MDYYMLNNNPNITLDQKNAYRGVGSYFTTHPTYQHHFPSFDTVLNQSILNELPLLPRADFQRHLYLVAFKAGRVNVYCTTTINDLHIQVNDIVIVNVDDDKVDIGKVIRCNVSEDYVRYLKYQQHDIQENALVASGVIQHPRDLVLFKPKEIIRFAECGDVNLISMKNEDEERASTLCRKELIRQYNLQRNGMDPTTLMDIIYCEYQFDKKNITFYYKCSEKVKFTNLNSAMYKLFNTRIWMCILPGGLDDQFINRMREQIQTPARQKNQPHQMKTLLWLTHEQTQIHTLPMEISRSRINNNNNNNNNSSYSYLFEPFADSMVYPIIYLSSNSSLNSPNFPPKNTNRNIFNDKNEIWNISGTTDKNRNASDKTNVVHYNNYNALTKTNRLSPLLKSTHRGNLNRRNNG